MNNSQNGCSPYGIGIESEHSLIDVVSVDLAFYSTLISKSAYDITQHEHKENHINNLMVTNNKYDFPLKLKFVTNCMEGSNYE